jgi:hypothetical protein
MPIVLRTPENAGNPQRFPQVYLHAARSTYNCLMSARAHAFEDARMSDITQ